MATICDEYRSLAELKPHERNYNRHEPQRVAALADQIRHHAFTAPFVITPDGIILAGHRRRLALEKLRSEAYPEPKGVERGWRVPCRVFEGNEAQQLAILAGDNPDPQTIDYDSEGLAALLADLKASGDLVGTGYSEPRLAELIAELAGEVPAGEGESGLLPDADPDEIPEQVETRCKPGDLWALGRHRLLCGDSTDAETVERLLDGAVPNLMVTDPPYGVEYDANWRNEADRANGKPYGASSVGLVSNDDRADWTEAWELFPGSVVYCWHADRHASEVQRSLEAAGFEMRTQIIWAKNRFAISRGGAADAEPRGRRV